MPSPFHSSWCPGYLCGIPRGGECLLLPYSGETEACAQRLVQSPPKCGVANSTSKYYMPPFTLSIRFAAKLPSRHMSFVRRQTTPEHSRHDTRGIRGSQHADSSHLLPGRFIFGEVANPYREECHGFRPETLRSQVASETPERSSQGGCDIKA
jgi:hypothetical protein